MGVRKRGSSLRRLAGFGLLGLGCSSPCSEVAELLRECCAKGPAELRGSCEKEAEQLESDGNDEACQSALDRGHYERCAK
jgi:hypothetical protein